MVPGVLHAKYGQSRVALGPGVSMHLPTHREETG